MRPFYILLLFFALVACAGTAPTVQLAPPTPKSLASPVPIVEQSISSNKMEPAMTSAYPDLGPAPEITGEVWLNTSSPLRLSELRGKVVLVDMWTFG